MLLAAAGAHLMAAAADLIVLFIGLEVFSISLYVLAGFTRERADADEASLKYFLLGAFASAVFLYGVALVFAATGTTTIYGSGGIADYLADYVVLRPGVLLAGLALLLAGMAFKVTAAPFHVWAPDVYQGAPGGITGFLAASAKVAGFAALARVLTAALGARVADWAPAVAVLAAISVVVGTLLAIAQDDVKRLLAYSVGGPRRLHPHRPGGRPGRPRRHVVLRGHLRGAGGGGLHRGRGGLRRRARAVPAHPLRRPGPPLALAGGGDEPDAAGHGRDPAHRRLRREGGRLPGGHRRRLPVAGDPGGGGHGGRASTSTCG